jgi:C_GCAxxG_C_C family probable redox protein
MTNPLPEVEEAAATFAQGFTCGQAVLGSFAERFGMRREQAFQVACAFGGGMARTGQLCGAVAGAQLVLGLALGQSKAGDQAARERTYAATKELWVRFRERHGSVVCRELLGVDIGTPEGQAVAKEAGLFETRCPQYVRDAAEIVAGLV